MGAYRLVVFESAAGRDVSFEFEAETDRDAVRVGNAAAAGESGALWRDGRLLLKLERVNVDGADRWRAPISQRAAPRPR